MELVALSYSPWSEKARWALDHHALAYTYSHFVPMLGELPLRIRAGKLRGKITVPILFDRDRVVDDSFDIAKHADALGKNAPLFPPADGDRIGSWNTRSEELLAAGRALVIQNILNDREAQRESLPPFVPGPLRDASVAVAAMGARYLGKKHGTLDADIEARLRTVDAGLATLRESLGGKAHLVGGFSYADIAMAVTLQMVTPVAKAYLPLGRALRRCWTMPSLATKYADLLEWRDALYAKHRALPSHPAHADADAATHLA